MFTEPFYQKSHGGIPWAAVAGIPIDIERTGADVFGGYAATAEGGGFQSPIAPDPNALFIGLSWTGAGDVAAAAVSGGFLRLPPGEAGEGQWSFREGLLLRAEDDARGDLLFSITSVVKSAPGVCESSPVWAELRGCWASRE
jgi:hypothetical protein